MANARERRRERRKVERTLEDIFGELIETIETDMDLSAFSLDDKAKALENALKKALDVKEVPADFNAKELLIAHEEKAEVEEKTVAVAEAWYPLGGAQSWQELDKYLEAEETAQKTRRAVYEFETMVENILEDTTIDLDEKAERVAALSYALPVRATKKEADPEPKNLIEKFKAFISPGDKDDSEEPTDNFFRIYKDSEGNNRWFGMVTNKWRDLDRGSAPKHGGEILTEEAHKDFITWVDAKPEKRMPELRAWHMKETTHQNRVDFIEYLNGFVIASGILTDKEVEGIKRLEKTYNLGMSHGLYPLEIDKENELITKYRTFEVSYLPLEYAANPFTDFVTVDKESTMNEEKQAFLTQLTSSEFVAELLEDTEKKATILDDAGVESKEIETPEAEVEVAEKSEEVEEEEAPKGGQGPIDLKAVIKALEEKMGMEELGEVLAGIMAQNKTLEEKIVALEKSDDEKVADKMKPEIDVEVDVIPLWKKRLSQSEETKVDDKEVEGLVEKEIAAEGLGWVKETFESAPTKDAIPQ